MFKSSFLCFYFKNDIPLEYVCFNFFLVLFFFYVLLFDIISIRCIRIFCTLCICMYLKKNLLFILQILIINYCLSFSIARDFIVVNTYHYYFNKYLGNTYRFYYIFYYVCCLPIISKIPLNLVSEEYLAWWKIELNTIRARPLTQPPNWKKITILTTN